jgi:hypothetical protein
VNDMTTQTETVRVHVRIISKSDDTPRRVVVQVQAAETWGRSRVHIPARREGRPNRRHQPDFP